MEQHEKQLFATVLFREAKDLAKRGKPEFVPESLVTLHDDSKALNRAFCTKTRPDSDQYWILVKMDEILNRIAALEAKLAAPVIPKNDDLTKALREEQGQHIDLRTKEGRAMKAQMVGAA